MLITTNKSHPAFCVDEANVHVILQDELSLNGALEKLKRDFGCDRLTVQSGGTLNGLFLRDKLFDYVDVVVAPVLVGGGETSTLIDGESLKGPDELSKLGVLELIECVPLENSYVRLRYKMVG